MFTNMRLGPGLAALQHLVEHCLYLLVFGSRAWKHAWQPESYSCERLEAHLGATLGRADTSEAIDSVLDVSSLQKVDGSFFKK